MISARSALRSTRAIRFQAAPPLRRNVRFQSNTSSSSGSSGGGLSPAVTGGVVGSVVSFAGIYTWYHFSGLKPLVQTSKSIKSSFKSSAKSLQENTPEPSEALDWLRSTATSYVGFIPGAKKYVDTAFDDIDTVRSKHGDKVDKIVRDAYEDLKDVTKSGKLDMATAQKTMDVLSKYVSQLGELSKGASMEILDNHPQLKEKVGGNIDQLKKMGEQYGPEAKKQVDKTWDQIRELVNNGVNADTANKIRQVVQEKTETLRKMGDEAWQKGMEQAEPYLDKNPKVKEIIEQNKDALKQGNAKELFDRAKRAVDKGDTGDLEGYVKDAVDNAKDSGFGGMDQYLKIIPGADQIFPKLEQLQDVAKKHGQEAEKLLNDTVNEIQDILSKKSKEAEDLANKAKDQAKDQ